MVRIPPWEEQDSAGCTQISQLSVLEVVSWCCGSETQDLHPLL